MARTNRTTKLVAVLGLTIIALGMTGCTGDQLTRLGDRLIDGMTLSVGTGEDGGLVTGFAFSTEVASQRSQQREINLMRLQLMQNTVGVPAQNQGESLAPVSPMLVNDAVRDEVRRIVLEELFAKQGPSEFDLARFD